MSMSTKQAYMGANDKWNSPHCSKLSAYEKYDMLASESSNSFQQLSIVKK